MNEILLIAGAVLLIGLYVLGRARKDDAIDA